MQDDEYHASLLADKEKELKALEEAEARRLEEEVAREKALEEDRRKEEESQKKLEEEQVLLIDICLAEVCYNMDMRFPLQLEKPKNINPSSFPVLGSF